MPTFDFLSLLWWGLPLTAAPIIIHLINLLRHRKVPWAAMEFLVASQRKYRTRVLLKQILLLLLRVLAVLAVVCALAQPHWKNALGQLLGGTRTSHAIVLDDSYSMSDLSVGGGVGDTSAFDRAKLAVERICSELVAAPGIQELTIGRFSRVGLIAASQSVNQPVSAVPEKSSKVIGLSGQSFLFESVQQVVTPLLVQQVQDALATLAPSATDVGPQAALTAAANGSAAATGAANVVWLVSDFRAATWRSADDTAELLRRLSVAGTELRLVDCAESEAQNLTIERLEMVGGVPAAGVLVPLEVAVRNHSSRPARDVPIELREDGQARPGLRIPEIPAGGIATQRLDVRFPRSGSHVVDARIFPDAVAADNTRTAVIDIVDRVDVLLIDGDPRGAARTGDAFYLSAALAPGSGAPTGLRPRIEQPRSLATLDLKTFDCIWLLDVERLDPVEIAAVEAFARAGGGVVFFVGPRTNAEAVNLSLVRDGAGLFPLPLAGPVDFLAEKAHRIALEGGSEETVPDVVVEEHPVVAVFSGQRNPLLDAVRIERFMAVQRGFEPPAGSGLRRLLSLRNGLPLIVERPYGNGLVVAVLTTAAPTWNNWARGNPSWVVVMLELESHLARTRRKAQSMEVGEAVSLSLDAERDGDEVDFLIPPDGTLVHQTAKPSPGGGLVATLPEAGTAGPYTARWKQIDGIQREQSFAVNVDPDEGRLERIGRERLDRTLSGVVFRFDHASSMQPDSGSLAGVSLVTPLLYAILAMLLVEQAVSYSASYHPTVRQKRSV